jgi:sulfoxide reductase heme-binding subunit YedZ
VVAWWNSSLGADQIAATEIRTGLWTLRFLAITLAVTPARQLLGVGALAKYRRMLGLFAFFYVSLHFLWYLFVDQAFDWRQLAGDVVKRPYITAGFTAFLLLVPLAATSTRRAMRRLGRRWQKLHRLAYVAAILGCVHYWWQVKADVREPLTYAAVLALLLGWRLYDRCRRSAAARAASAARPRSQRRERDPGQNQKPSRAGAGLERLAEQPPGQH